MAPDMTRYTRKKLRSGTVVPVETFDAVDRSHCGVSFGCGKFVQLMRCKRLQTSRFPSHLRLLFKQIYAHHNVLIIRS